MRDVETTLTNMIRCRHHRKGCEWIILFQPGDSEWAERQRDTHQFVCPFPHVPYTVR